MSTTSADRQIANGSGHNEEPDHQPPPLDEIFGVLQNQRRRRILSYLETEDTPTTIGTLAEHVAAAENDIPASQLRSKQRKRVYISLYQSHLPKLAAVDAVEYDKDRGTVDRGPEFGAFRSVLHREEDVEGDSQVLRAGFSIGGALVLSAILLVGSSPTVVDATAFRLLTGLSLLVVPVLLTVGLFGHRIEEGFLGKIVR